MVSKLHLDQLPHTSDYARTMALRTQCIAIFEEAELGYKLSCQTLYAAERRHWRFEITRYGPHSSELVRLTYAAAQRATVLSDDILRWLRWTSSRRLHLPAHLLRNAFQFLDSTDLVAIQFTCKGWKKAADLGGALSRMLRGLLTNKLGVSFSASFPKQSSISDELRLWHQRLRRPEPSIHDPKALSTNAVCQLNDPSLIMSFFKAYKLITADRDALDTAIRRGHESCLAYFICHPFTASMYDVHPKLSHARGPSQWDRFTHNDRLSWTHLALEVETLTPMILYWMRRCDRPTVRELAAELQQLGNQLMQQRLKRAEVDDRHEIDFHLMGVGLYGNQAWVIKAGQESVLARFVFCRQ
jgi:hypothetical protein